MLVNLTPHPVVVISEDGTVLADIPPSGTVARLTETAVENDGPDGLPGAIVSLGAVEGLPEPANGTTYIASMPLLMGALAAGIDRPDLVYPYGQVRDENGRIVGCRSLASLARSGR